VNVEGCSFRALRLLLDMVAAGQIRSVIDRSFPLEEIVAAHRLVDTGHKRGSVVINVRARRLRASANESEVPRSPG
jgi:D-arabinose 1-dehydrogenase-like Zn-dependent alcohol dehydrogenase